jgi:hypothetical protein
MKIICLLGRQSALGLAELESRLGADSLQVLGRDMVIADSETVPDFDSFGGVLKAAKLLTRLDTTDFNKLSRHLQEALPSHLQYFPDGKITIGLSTYGLGTESRQINAAALSLKKIIKQNGRSARVVPNNGPELNTAQVLHNKLTGPAGMELLLVRDGNSTLLGRTLWVQDIDSYRRRDQERPARDARVGMLPPKLAQIILNLALGPMRGDVASSSLPNDAGGSLKNHEDPASSQKHKLESLTVLDPFCGTGVLLQEALLQGHSAYGTDLEERMIDYSGKNLGWIIKERGLQSPDYRLEQADATSAEWNGPFTTIACETYLGRALSSFPDKETFVKIVSDVNQIHKRFLQNVASQTRPGFRMCIAVPAWRLNNGFKHLPVLDHLEELGYNRVSFVHADSQDLVYHREGQIVGRELLVLTRK